MAISLPYSMTRLTTAESAKVNANFAAVASRALDKQGDTMTGDLLFTDASYDIGKSGLTRPRDLFLSRNLTAGGTLTVSGAATLSSTLTLTSNLRLLNGTLARPDNTAAAILLGNGTNSIYGTTYFSGTSGTPQALIMAGDSGYMEFNEVSDPSAPSTNYGRLYMRDNGAGKTQLVARFPTGAIQVIATEP